MSGSSSPSSARAASKLATWRPYAFRSTSRSTRPRWRPVEQDHPRAGAEHRALEAPQRLVDPVQRCSRMIAVDSPPGIDQAVELRRAARPCAPRRRRRPGRAASPRARGSSPAERGRRRACGQCRGGWDRRSSTGRATVRGRTTFDSGEVSPCVVRSSWRPPARSRRCWSPARPRAKPPSGSRTGAGTVFLPNPVAELQDQSLTDQKDADYPALAGGVPRRHADRSRRQRAPLRRVGLRHQRDGRSAPTRRRPVPLPPRRRPLRAGHGVLLGHAGAAVPAVARLRVGAPSDQRRAAGHPGRHVGPGQLVLLGQARRVSASARAASTTPRTPRSSCTSTATP